MPKNAVVDASVLVSAFFFPQSLPGDVVAYAQAGRYTIFLSPILIEEVRRSLMNPRLTKAYGHSLETVDDWCHELLDMAVIVTDLPAIPPTCRDPDDRATPCHKLPRERFRPLAVWRRCLIPASWTRLMFPQWLVPRSPGADMPRLAPTMPGPPRPASSH